MEVETECPYCGEPLTLWIDSGGGSSQRYVEDCAVCCRPMTVQTSTDEDGNVSAHVARDDE